MQHQYPKFRAWHKELKEMFMVEHMQWKDGVVTHITRFRKFGNSRQDLPVNELKYIELMQWIGWKDSNKKDVYIGDIIKLYNPYEDVKSSMLIIKHDGDMNYAFECLYKGSDYEDWEIDGFAEHEITVVGNIWENPECL